MSETSIPIWLWAVMAVLIGSGIILPEVLSLLQPEYSSAQNYLSELGAIGAPNAPIINVFGFAPVAISSLMILVYIAVKQDWGRAGYIGAALLAFGLSTGYLIAVFFPCDLGCPVQGSARQSVHNLAGLVQYPAGVVGLFMMGRAMRRAAPRNASHAQYPQTPGSFLERAAPWVLSLASAAMALGFAMMIAPEQAAWRGAWQRLGDYSAFMALIIVTLVSAKKRAARH